MFAFDEGDVGAAGEVFGDTGTDRSASQHHHAAHLSARCIECLEHFTLPARVGEQPHVIAGPHVAGRRAE